MLGSGRLHQGDSIELAQEGDEPTKICSGGWAEEDGAGVLSGEGVEEPGDEDPGGVEKFAEETLKLLDRYGRGGEEFDAEDPGFFHFERVNCHGEPHGVENHSRPIQVMMVVGP